MKFPLHNYNLFFLQYYLNKNISISNNLQNLSLLNLQSDKAYKTLNWKTKWDFERTIYETIKWYKDTQDGKDEFCKCVDNIISYIE